MKKKIIFTIILFIIVTVSGFIIYILYIENKKNIFYENRYNIFCSLKNGDSKKNIVKKLGMDYELRKSISDDDKKFYNIYDAIEIFILSNNASLSYPLNC